MNILVLASTSPQKKSLLNKLGINFMTAETEVEEIPEKQEKPETYARRIALAKAIKASKANRNKYVLSHDLTIDFGGEIVDKPKDEKEAAKILKKLSGKKHDVIGALVIMRNGKAFYQGVQSTEIKFKKLTKKQIDAHAKSEEALESVGAYSIQGKGRDFIDTLEGSYFNVVGLPINILIRALEKVDFDVTEEVKQTVTMQENSIKEAYLK